MGTSKLSETDQLLEYWDNSRACQLTKEWLESGDDVLPDVIKYHIHSFPDIKPIRSHDFLERYRESALELHFHFSRIGSSPAPDYCISATNGVSNVTQEGLGTDECERQSLVLVEIGEIAEPGERMDRIGREVVRLKFLDDCYSLIGNPIQTPALGIDSTIPSLGVAANRELIAPRRNGGERISENELPDQMIERRTEIVQTVARHDAEDQRWLREFCNELNPAGIRVALFSDHAVRFAPRNLALYRLEMFFSPDDFAANTVKRMAH